MTIEEYRDSKSKFGIPKTIEEIYTPVLFSDSEEIDKYIKSNGSWKDFIGGMEEIIGKHYGFPKIVRVEFSYQAKITDEVRMKK